MIICDWFSADGWVNKKPWYWAHLRRDFQAMIDRDDGGSLIEVQLLKLSDNMFRSWHLAPSGELSPDRFLGWAGPNRSMRACNRS